VALERLRPDFTPLRASRDLRLLVAGNVVTGFGTQAALVALPYQLFVETRSAFLVGLLGAAELLPLVAMALYGGALADRMDRRRLLLLDQIALVSVASALAGLAADMGALRPGRPDGRLRRRAERGPLGDRAEPRRARAAAPGAGRELRAVPDHAGGRAGAGRPADRNDGAEARPMSSTP
jgi:hypothetical protein